MKAFTLLALVAPAFAEELLARGGGGDGGDWGYGDKTTKVTYTTSTYNVFSSSLLRTTGKMPPPLLPPFKSKSGPFPARVLSIQCCSEAPLMHDMY